MDISFYCGFSDSFPGVFLWFSWWTKQLGAEISTNFFALPS
jgi:hypothetical protein